MQRVMGNLFSWIERPVGNDVRNIFRMLIAISLIIKSYELFPPFDFENLLQGISVIVACACGLSLLFNFHARLSSLLGSIAVLFLYFNPPVQEWLSHNAQLLFFCLFAFALDAEDDKAKFSLPGLRILQALIFIIYFNGVWVKFDPAYVSGLRLQQLYMLNYASSDAVAWALFPLVCKVLALGSIVIEILIPVGLLIRKFRPYAIILGIILHTMMAVFLPVSVFSFLMIALLILFLEKNFLAKRMDGYN